MKLSALNGKAPLQGFSRVYPKENFTPANGFSRVINGITMNGPTEADLLSALPQHIQREFLMAVQLGDPVASMNGLKDWIARRKEIKEAKKDAKIAKVEARADAALNRISTGTDLGSTLRNVAGNVIQTAGGLATAGLQKLGEKYIGGATTEQKVAMAEAMEETPSGETRGLFSSKSAFQKWWEDLSTPAKVGVVAGAVVVTDALLGGPIILQRVGVMKKKGKK